MCMSMCECARTQESDARGDNSRQGSCAPRCPLCPFMSFTDALREGKLAFHSSQASLQAPALLRLALPSTPARRFPARPPYAVFPAGRRLRCFNAPRSKNRIEARTQSTLGYLLFPCFGRKSPDIGSRNRTFSNGPPQKRGFPAARPLPRSRFRSHSCLSFSRRRGLGCWHQGDDTSPLVILPVC